MTDADEQAVQNYGITRTDGSVRKARRNQNRAFPKFILVDCSKEGWDHCRPERWDDDVPVEAVNALPGVYGQLMTVIAGAHSCVGYRFPVIECVILSYNFLSRSQKRAEAHPAPQFGGPSEVGCTVARDARAMPVWRIVAS